MNLCMGCRYPYPMCSCAPVSRSQRYSGAVPVAWQRAIVAAADFEPENDEHLLTWMTGEIRGMAGYAEALIEVWENGVYTTGIDPVALKALRDVADAVTQAAWTMNLAKRQFTGHYELPREYAAAGKLMTHDGRWVTGQGS